MKVFLLLLNDLFVFIDLYLKTLFKKPQENKILVIPDTYHGGSAKILIELINSFCDDYSFEIIKNTAIPECEDFPFQNKKIYTIDFPKVILPLNVRSKSFLLNLHKTLYELNQYFEIVYRANPKTIILNIGAVYNLVFLLLIPRIVFYYLHSLPDKKIDFCRGFILKSFLGKKKKLVTVSRYVQGFFLSECGVKNNVNVIHNYADKNFFTGDLDVSKKGEEVIFISVGEMVEYKRPDIWLLIAQNITGIYTNVKFHWLGSGKLLKTYQEITKSNSKINFLGFKSNTYDHLKGASIFLHTSEYENHSLAILEAQASGLPVICFDVGGNGEIIEDGLNGYLVIKNDVEAYKKCCLELLNDPGKLKRMGIQSKKLIREKYSFENFKREWKNLLETI